MFKFNSHLVDHKVSDVGFYDLLLHSSDRAYSIGQLLKTLQSAGLDWVGAPEPALYDSVDLLPKGMQLPESLDRTQTMAIAENLRGTFKTHIAYAKPFGTQIKPPLGQPQAIPHLKGIDPRRLAQAIAQKGEIRITAGGEKIRLPLPKAAAPLIATIDGRRDLAAIRSLAKLDPFAFATLWGPVERALCGYGQMHYSSVLK